LALDLKKSLEKNEIDDFGRILHTIHVPVDDVQITNDFYKINENN